MISRRFNHNALKNIELFVNHKKISTFAPQFCKPWQVPGLIKNNED